MPTLDDRVQQRIDALLDRSRDQLRAELAAFVRALDEEARARQDAALSDARAEAHSAALASTASTLSAERAAAAERQAAALADAARTAEASRAEALEALRAELERERTAALEDVEARAERDLASAVVAWRATERQSEMAALSAIADGVRALDDASTLSETLDALVEAVAAHAPRAALVVARDGQLRGWRWRGFEGDAAECTIAADAPGPVALAFRSNVSQTITSGASGDGPLSPIEPGRAAVAVPLDVDGRPVAVLYADDGAQPRTVPSAWPEIVEVLVRHASRCLEAKTARRLPDLVRASAAERTRQQTLHQDDDAAQRYARLLVAEIRLYHERALEEARRERDILRRLRPQIERAERLYAERVPDAVRSRTDYFSQELVRTLAGGDAALLGRTT
jgi:hypothetical protein